MKARQANHEDQPDEGASDDPVSQEDLLAEARHRWREVGFDSSALPKKYQEALGLAVREHKALWRCAPRIPLAKGGLEISTTNLVGRLGFPKDERVSSETLFQRLLDIVNNDATPGYTSPVHTPTEREMAFHDHVKLHGKEKAQQIFDAIPPEAEVWAFLHAFMRWRIDDPVRLRDYFVTNMVKRLENLTVQMLIDTSGKEIRVSHVPSFLIDEWDFLAVCCLMLLDEQLPFGRNLCRCRLEACGKFFLATQDPAGGAPRRRYCTKDHMEKAHILKITDLVRKSRKEKKEAKRTAGRRRHK